MTKQENYTEQIITGVPASPGIAIGKVFLMGGDVVKVVHHNIREEEIPIEIEKFKEAVERTKLDLKNIQAEAARMLDPNSAKIFDAHQLMLEDELIVGETVRKIRTEKKNADFVFLEVIEKFEQSLSQSKNEYLQGRTSDLRDVKRRVILNIQGSQRHHLALLNSPAIIIAKEITPSDAVLVDRSKVLGFATDFGGRTSHAAIMARSLLVPSVVGLKQISSAIKTGDRIILDGTQGQVIINPSKATLNRYRKLQVEFHNLVRKLEEIRELPARTFDGRDVELSANIEFPDELDSVRAYGAKGVGLYRTEYLFLARRELPTEEEQFREYKRIADGVYPNSVIIRTMDLGGDKIPDNISVPPEMNPFLGFRAIRISLEKVDVFQTQLRAILRASSKKNVKILLPMVSNIVELRACKHHLEQCKATLRKEQELFDPDIELGVMIEIPSAAVIADLLARECAFLSIGTNDLTQYMLAVDRGNTHIAYLYRTFDPSVIRIIKSIIDNGHRQGVWVGMCGEMAGDPLATLILLGFGLDEFSVSPVSLPLIKEIIRRVEFVEAQHMAQRVLEMMTADEIETYLKGIMQRKFKDLPI